MLFKLSWLQHHSISEFDGSLIYSRQVKCWEFFSSGGELTFSKKKKKVKSHRMTAVQPHYFLWKGQLCGLSLLCSFLCGASFKSFIPKCSYCSGSHCLYLSFSLVAAKHPEFIGLQESSAKPSNSAVTEPRNPSNIPFPKSFICKISF